jgi:hypothetical protein
MPSGADGPELLLDTSAALPLLFVDSEHHDVVDAAVGDALLGLAGHAAFETFSVLTRMPPPLRTSPRVALQLIRENFPGSTGIPPGPVLELLETFVELGISGGAVYDGLIGAAALHQGVPLLSRDQRATDTYRRLDVEIVLLD